MFTVMRPWPHHDIISLWLTAFLLFSIFQHPCFASFLPLYHPLLLLLMSVSLSSPLSAPFLFHTNLSSCPSTFFVSLRSFHCVSRRPSPCSSYFGPVFPLFLLLCLFPSLLRTVDIWEVTSSRRCAQQECSDPPSHWPATGHSDTVCVEERRTHWVFCYLWQRLGSAHLHICAILK